MLEEIERLRAELAESKQVSKNNDNAADILSGFISKGKARFKQDGNVVLVGDEDDDNFVNLEPEDII